MTYWTEDMIREVLDGTYTRLDPEGRVFTEVGDARMPVNRGGRPRGSKVRQAPWDPSEEDLLVQMKRRNRPLREIAWVLARSEESVKQHYKVLKVKGAVMP